jgi:steroid delta-isomerase-like uncharacterized protein
MAHPFVPSLPVLTRRAAMTRIGAGGLALGLGVHARPALAQQDTADASPEALPPALEIWVSGWEAADPDQLAQAYAEDAMVEVVPFNTTLPGQGAIQQYFTAYFGAFAEPDPKITLVFATEEHAAAEWTFEGQYTGQLPGLPPGEGRSVSVRGANIMTLHDGAIVEEHIYTDLAGCLANSDSAR